MPTTFSIAFLSNDDQFLITVYHSKNLLALDHPPNEMMLTFFDQRTLVAHVRLNELIKNRQLPRTASHYHWTNAFGFQTDHRFRIETTDARTHVFDVTTEKRATTQRKKRSPEK